MREEEEEKDKGRQELDALKINNLEEIEKLKRDLDMKIRFVNRDLYFASTDLKDKVI